MESIAGIGLTTSTAAFRAHILCHEKRFAAAPGTLNIKLAILFPTYYISSSAQQILLKLVACLCREGKGDRRSCSASSSTYLVSPVHHAQ